VKKRERDMCGGVPYHAAEGYIGKLIRKGFQGGDL